MSGAAPIITIGLVGPMRIRGTDGQDRTPNGRKACALIAMLALSPNHRRTRAWLQSKLWSDRGDDQGAASLRQTLSEIRRAFATDKICLKTEKQTVQLDPETVVVTLEASEDGDDKVSDESGVLLEGLTIRDPAFEAWLTKQRQKHQARQAPPIESNGNSGAEFLRQSGFPVAPRLYVTNELPAGERDESHSLAGLVSDMMAKSIKELLAADIIDDLHDQTIPEQGPSNIDAGSLRLSTEVASVGTAKVLRFRLIDLSDNSLVWTDTISDLTSLADEIASPETFRQINQVANVAASHLGQSSFDKSPERLAFHYCQLGISHLFRLGRSNFETADSYFAQAFDLHARGLYLAWRAYLRLFMHAERQFECRQTLEEEAVGFAARGMEIEPFNSVVNSLASHVQLTVIRSYAAAFDLAEQSIRLNQANCLGWLSLGVAQCQLGQHEEGFKNSLFAREMCGPAPYRFQVDGLCCIAATVSGRYKQATHLGETSHAFSPMFAPALRFLIALYSKQGATERAYRTMEKLKQIEPDFSFELLREDGYPAASLRRTSLLESLPSHEV